MQKEKVVKACKSTIGTILIAIFIVIGVFLAVKICWGTEIENIFMLANKVSININKDTSLSPIWSAYWDNYPYLTVTGTGYVAGSKEVTNNMMLVDFYGEYEWRNTYSYPITLHYYIDNTYKTSDGSGIIWVSPNGERSNMYFYDSATDGNTKSGTCTVPPGYVLAIHNENDVRAWYTIYVQ